MSFSILSPEFKLMLSCCRVKPGTKELESRAEALGTSIDEEVFLALLIRHRVYPLVYFNLKEESRISEELKDKLKQLAAANQLQALQSRHMQFRLQKEFDLQAYKGFFLKGVTLSEQYYGDAGLRHVMDIDCWVEQKAVEPMAEPQSVGFHGACGIVTGKVRAHGVEARPVRQSPLWSPS